MVGDEIERSPRSAITPRSGSIAADSVTSGSNDATPMEKLRDDMTESFKVIDGLDGGFISEGKHNEEPANGVLSASASLASELSSSEKKEAEAPKSVTIDESKNTTAVDVSSLNATVFAYQMTGATVFPPSREAFSEFTAMMKGAFGSEQNLEQELNISNCVFLGSIYPETGNAV